MSAKRLAVLLVAVALVASACGTEDEALEPETVEVTTADYQFVGVPERVAAGSTFAMTNSSTAEIHELVALRLPDEEDRSIEELLALPEEELGEVIGQGPPAVVLVAPPGEDAFLAAGDETVSQPGRYALVCFFPVGGDPAEVLATLEALAPGEPPDWGDAEPHAARGMYAEVTVE